MKKYFLLIIVPFILVSCNEKINPEDNIPTSKTELLISLGDEEETLKTSKKIEEIKTESVSAIVPKINNERIATKQKPLLIARGNEPGWYAEFYKDKLHLLLDYGKDSVFVENNFSDITKPKSYKASLTKAILGNGKSKTITLAIIIDTKPCTEAASGEKRERTITLKYNNKTYKGCATIN